MTRVLRLFAAILAVFSTGLTLLATHWPTPGATAAQGGGEGVRATWSALRAIGDHLPDSPAFLDPVFDDKVLHLLMFFWPSFWAGLALGRRIRTTLGNRVLAGFLTWALVDEWLQLATGRGCEAADALANVVGVFAGVVAALSVVALVARIRPVSPEVGTRPPKSARGVP